MNWMLGFVWNDPELVQSFKCARDLDNLWLRRPKAQTSDGFKQRFGRNAELDAFLLKLGEKLSIDNKSGIASVSLIDEQDIRIDHDHDGPRTFRMYSSTVASSG